MQEEQYPIEISSSINGHWIGDTGFGGEQVLNPATGQVLGELAHVGPSDLDQALDAADCGWRNWSARAVDERSAILHEAAGILDKKADQIAAMLSREQGKPLVQARGDVAGGIALLRLHAEEAKRTYGRTLVRQPGQRASVTYEPVGPAAGFAPWNFPFFNVARKVAPALAAGCAIIVKPAEETPASAAALQQALLDAGVPGSASQLVYGNPAQVSDHLLASPIIRKVSFTGSVPVGKQIAKLAADGVKRTTLELGGHAPVIIFDDADLDRSLDMLVTAKFRNAGQVCVSPTRFYIQEGIYDRFAAGFVERTERRVCVGDPFAEKTVMGPLANNRRTSAMAQLVNDARGSGAKILAGGEAIDGRGHFFQPTVIADVPSTARIMNDEPFGPVAAISRFRTFDEAIEMGNRLPYGLAAYVFTQSLNRALRASDALEAGMVAVNSVTLSTGDAPFGGIKESGQGMEDGPEGLHAYLVPKVIHIG